MKRTFALPAAVVLFAACSAVWAEYGVIDRGEWPASWPKELEPLRARARTLEGPMVPYQHYLIPFAKREEFEAAWPHLLKVKSKGAPVILVRGPRTDFFAIRPAGVLIHAPPAGTDWRVNPEGPIPGVANRRERWMNATYIELAVDGNVVDLNRIPLPADTPIVDERFKGQEKPQGAGPGANAATEPQPAPAAAAAPAAPAPAAPAPPATVKPDGGGAGGKP